MVLPIFVVFLSWISIALAAPEVPGFTEEQLASSPLIRQLLDRVDKLEELGARQEDEIQSLKVDLAHQRSHVVKMRLRLKAKNKTIQSLLQQINPSETRESATNESPSSTDVVTKRRTSEGSQRIRQLQNEVSVAFTAGLTAHMLQVGDKQNIIFDHVITNVGNAYNPHHGVFVAPVSGTYVFATSILSYDARNNWASIVVNGTIQTMLFMHDDSHALSSQTVVLQLNKGDDVAIQGHPGDAYFGQPQPYTTFSGFLLQQDYSNANNVIG
ncbi:hypothetical protein ACF0H5_007956 [Mactra antiquata]